MEIKLPTELEQAMIDEIKLKPGMDKRSYVLEAIRHQISADRGYRERADRRRAERSATDYRARLRSSIVIDPNRYNKDNSAPC